MLDRVFLPGHGIVRAVFTGHEARLGIAGRVEDALDMPAVGQHELDLAAEQVRRAVAGLPRGDVVGSAGDAVDVAVDLLQVDGGTAHFRASARVSGLFLNISIRSPWKAAGRRVVSLFQNRMSKIGGSLPSR